MKQDIEKLKIIKQLVAKHHFFPFPLFLDFFPRYGYVFYWAGVDQKDLVQYRNPEKATKVY